MSVTLQEVAREAAVSPMTVSRVLNGKADSVAAATRERVLRIAAKVGYRPNINARALASRKSLLVGVLFSEANYVYATQLLSGLQEALVGRQYAPIFLNHNNPEDEKKNLEICLARNVDALIVNPWVEENGRSTVDVYTNLAKSGLPVVEIYGRQVPGVPWVCHDSVAQGRIATEYLQKRGHRRIALFTHSRYRACETQPGRSWDAYEQWQGYTKQMQAAGQEHLVIAAPLDGVPLPRDGTSLLYQAALRGVQELFAHAYKPTALVCYSIHMAYAVMTAARERGIRVPQDLSLITAGAGVEVFGMPRLTNIMPQSARLGRVAGDLVMQIMDGKKYQSAVIEPTLNEAESVLEPVS